MIKLNRKGYMTVEIIIASVIAFSIAFFLMEITMKLVDITDNEYINTNFMTDKALVMKNVKKNIEKDISENGKVSTLDCNGTNYCMLIFNNGNRFLAVENEEIMYLDNDGSKLYSKKLDKNYGDISLTGGNDDNYIYFQIKGNNIFDDENYDINIVVYNG